MSGCYLFFRLCSNLNSTFPADRLDEVNDHVLSEALDALARKWLEQHPGAVATVEEVTKLLTLGDDRAESHEVDLDELRWDIDEFRCELGIHPDQPLFLRVAPLAGWGFPLPQPLFGGQVVSERCFFARAPGRATAESALERIRRLAAESFDRNWMRLHFGCCSESGFTEEERKTIEISSALIDLWSDSPSFIEAAQRVLDKVVEVEARAKADQPKTPGLSDRTPVAESQRVKLFGLNDPPLIDGKPKSPLTKPRYEVVQLLIQAGPEGLTKDGLASRHGGAVNMVKALRKSDGDWGDVIKLPGSHGRRYRIE
jgi:hypothetical protein